MYNGLHFVPLVKLESVLCDVSAEGSSGVTMSPITLRELSLIVDTIRLHETLNVSPWLIESVTHLVNEREIIALVCNSQLASHGVLH